jgi:tetratricopeptide (TPR) repeat protein
MVVQASNLACNYLRLHRTDDAIASFDKAIARLHELNDPRIAVNCVAAGAGIHFILGNLERAEELLRRVEGNETLRELDAVRARIAIGRGRTADGLLFAERAFKQNVWEIPNANYAVIALAYAEALDAAGRFDEAKQALREGRAHLLDHAAKISDPKRAKAFLEDIPENRQLLARWESSNGDLDRLP